MQRKQEEGQEGRKDVRRRPGRQQEARKARRRGGREEGQEGRKEDRKASGSVTG